MHTPASITTMSRALPLPQKLPFVPSREPPVEYLIHPPSEMPTPRQVYVAVIGVLFLFSSYPSMPRPLMSPALPNTHPPQPYSVSLYTLPLTQCRRRRCRKDLHQPAASPATAPLTGQAADLPRPHPRLALVKDSVQRKLPPAKHRLVGVRPRLVQAARP